MSRSAVEEEAEEDGGKFESPQFSDAGRHVLLPIVRDAFNNFTSQLAYSTNAKLDKDVNPNEALGLSGSGCGLDSDLSLTKKEDASHASTYIFLAAVLELASGEMIRSCFGHHAPASKFASEVGIGADNIAIEAELGEEQLALALRNNPVFKNIFRDEIEACHYTMKCDDSISQWPKILASTAFGALEQKIDLGALLKTITLLFAEKNSDNIDVDSNQNLDLNIASSPIVFSLASNDTVESLGCEALGHLNAISAYLQHVISACLGIRYFAYKINKSI
jgi:hypothetical protein